MKEFSVTILGSSSATPTSTRFPSSQVVSYNYKPFLVDCGEGTQIQLRKNQIRFSKINHIFISHLHGDHFFGLIGLLSSFNLLARKTELNLYAPKEIKKVIDIQLEVTETTLHFPIIYHSLKANIKSLLFEDQQIRISAFPLNHSIQTWGFLFEEKSPLRKLKKSILTNYKIPDHAFEELKEGKDFVDENGVFVPNELLTNPGPKARSYAYCSDTAYHPTITEYLPKVDLIYHEASFMEDLRKVAEDKKHSTTIDAANTAMNVGAKHLLIGHFSARYKELDSLLAETRSVFSNTLLAMEGLRVEI